MASYSSTNLREKERAKEDSHSVEILNVTIIPYCEISNQGYLIEAGVDREKEGRPQKLSQKKYLLLTSQISLIGGIQW